MSRSVIIAIAALVLAAIGLLAVYFLLPSMGIRLGNSFGGFSSSPIVKLLDNGRDVELQSDFLYTDPNNNLWPVPAGHISDGASIPRQYWSFIGSPLTGKYRDAAIVHDYYCQKFDTAWPEPYKRSWQSVHRSFYYAMLARGVEKSRADFIFGAVYHCGPRWEWSGDSVRKIETWCSSGGDVNAEDVIQEYTKDGNRSVEEIEALPQVDQRFRAMTSTTTREWHSVPR